MKSKNFDIEGIMKLDGYSDTKSDRSRGMFIDDFIVKYPNSSVDGNILIVDIEDLPSFRENFIGCAKYCIKKEFFNKAGKKSDYSIFPQKVKGFKDNERISLIDFTKVAKINHVNAIDILKECKDVKIVKADGGRRGGEKKMYKVGEINDILSRFTADIPNKQKGNAKFYSVFFHKKYRDKLDELYDMMSNMEKDIKKIKEALNV